MELKSVYIRRDQYTDKRPLVGTLELGGSTGEIKITLSEENCQRILEVVAERLIEEAREGAEALTAAVIDATRPAALAAPR